jgi:spore coat protein CotH
MIARRFATPTVLLLLAAAASSASAQTADDLFAADTLHDVRIFMNSRDLQQLRDTYLENTYYQADLEWRGIRVRSVAVRSRGYGSRNPAKPGLLIDFDRFAPGQRFLGLASLTLDNLWQDPTLVRESVTMALFSRMGQPASRETFARLFINDVYQGVYAIVEAIDPVFLSRVFADAGGYLFEYRWEGLFQGEYLGRSLDRYKILFSPESHELESDASLYIPLHDLFREINAPDSATWRDMVERYLDVRGLLAHVAIETFVSELDGIVGGWGMNNFYVYRPSGSTRHVVIPWDRDHAFQAVETSVLLRVDQNIPVRRLLEYPDLRAYYFQMLETAAGAASGWLDGEIVARASLIREAARADTSKHFTDAEFESGIAFLRMFAQNRPAVVLQEIAALGR